jgi:hypothetical protein
LAAPLYGCGFGISGILYGRLKDCVIANNTLFEESLRELMVDNGGHGDGVVVNDNPGSLKRA